MSNIEENDLVVTPKAYIGKYTGDRGFGPRPHGVEVKGGNNHCLNDDAFGKCVKLNAPIRVKVTEPWQAEALVSLAEEHGFRNLIEPDGMGMDFNDSICLTPDNDGISNIVTWCPEDPNLTFVDNLPQIESWVKYHGESEDDEKCPDPRCEDGIIDDGPFPYPCPNCPEDEHKNLTDDPNNEAELSFSGLSFEDTDDPNPWKEATDDDSYSEPRPEDEEWRKLFFELYTPDQKGNQGLIDDLGFMLGDRMSKPLLDYIDNLEQELSDCWENQQEYKNDVDRLLRENAELQEELDKYKDATAYWKERYHDQDETVEKLQEELDEVKEERDELKQTAEFHRLNHKSQAEEAEELLNMMREYRNKRDNLRERIDEASVLLDWGYTQYPVKAVLNGENWKEWVNEEHYDDIQETIKEY